MIFNKIYIAINKLVKDRILALNKLACLHWYKAQVPMVLGLALEYNIRVSKFKKNNRKLDNQMKSFCNYDYYD